MPEPAKIVSNLIISPSALLSALGHERGVKKEVSAFETIEIVSVLLTTE